MERGTITMIAGKLTELIEIYSPHITVNDVGEKSTEYVLKNTTKANVIHNKGSRDIENDEIVYKYQKTFEVRIYVDVGEFDRIKWGSKYYRILDIDTNKELQKITIQTEVVNE